MEVNFFGIVFIKNMYSQKNKKYFLSSILCIDINMTKTHYYQLVSSNQWSYMGLIFTFIFSHMSLHLMKHNHNFFMQTTGIHKPDCQCSHQVASSTFYFSLSQVKFPHISLIPVFTVWSTSGVPWIAPPRSTR